MSETIRAFVAVRVAVSPELREVLGELAALGRAVKPVAAENLHLTVKFLGDTDSSWLADIDRVLHEAASRVTAFEVTLMGLGVFPKPARPSVVWTGIIPPAPVMQLATVVEEALVRFGFSAETRTFEPHVTLARVKGRPPQELASLLARYAETKFASFVVDELVLMRSDLTPQGSRYTPVSVAGLR